MCIRDSASGFYRFTHRDLGSSITAWARQNIKGIIAAVEQEGHGVVYSDTDSIFVRSPVDPDAPRQLTDEVQTLAQQGDKAALTTTAAYEAACSSMVEFGTVPALLEDLMAQRDEHKAAIKQAKSDGDEAAEAFHDAMQYAVKILMNSFYGVFASGFYRFTHRDLGSSITAWARQNIKGIIAAVEQEGHGVVYSDTDSIFVRSPVDADAPRQPVSYTHLTLPTICSV